MSDAWKFAGAGQRYLPVLNDAEDALMLPRDLLARMAFEESSFRPAVISGLIPSSVGALGILQLLPKFYKSVQRPVPFTYTDIVAQIAESARSLAGHFKRFGDWQEAVAAYNWGEGNEHHSFVEHGAYVLADMPTQTQNYVKQVFADVPIRGALLA